VKKDHLIDGKNNHYLQGQIWSRWTQIKKAADGEKKRKIERTIYAKKMHKKA
jgi:hypothetical protein